MATPCRPCRRVHPRAFGVAERLLPLLFAAPILVGAAGGCAGRQGGAGPSDGGNPDVAVGADRAANPNGDAGANDDGGAGASHEAGQRDAAPVVVDPAVSRTWTWSACGALPREPADVGAVFGDGDRIAVHDGHGARLYDGSGTLLERSDEPVDFLIAAPDGAVLTGVVRAPAIEMKPIGATAARFRFELPANVACGESFAFSVDGAHLLASGGSVACVWRMSDRAFVGSFATPTAQAAVRGDRIVTVEDAGTSVHVVQHALTGEELSRVPIDAGGPVTLSPSGDRVFGVRPQAALWDVDRGTRLMWMPNRDLGPVVPTFSPKGDLMLSSTGVVRTLDGVQVASINPASRLATFQGRPLALSPDGRRVVHQDFGRATLLDVALPGMVAVLGGLPLVSPFDSRRPTVDKLALSDDGSLLVVNIEKRAAFGLRLAPIFGASKPVWTMFAELNIDVDVSGDGHLAAISGDGRGLFSAIDGRVVWPPPVPPPNANLCATEKLRLSPKGGWAAGANFQRTLDVFAIGLPASSAPGEPVLNIPARCGDVAAFSRDERFMATSLPALYRTAAAPGDWQMVWAAEVPSSLPAPDWKGAANDVRFSPDETQLLVSQCDEAGACATKLLSVASGELIRELPMLTSPHPTFSPDGSWIIAGGTLLHLPSGDLRTLDGASTAGSVTSSLFTPDGDIIAGADAGLIRYCRNP